MCRSAVVSLLLALIMCNESFAVQYAYVVRFADKTGTPYSITSPGSFLSPRAISRRTSQGIAVDVTDLPVNPAYVDSVRMLTGGKMHGTSRWLNLCIVLLSDSVDIHVLDGKPFVAGTRFVGYYADSLHRPVRQEANVAQKSTGSSVYYGNTWQQTALVHGDLLHDAGYTGNGKLIAVIDEGFTDVESHPGFASMLSGGRLVDKYNFTLHTDFIYGYGWHGTRSLSTMAGYVPNTYVGTAPMASYALYISEDGNSEQIIELYNMLMATERADSIGADVVTSSLGYNTFDNPSDNFVFATDFDGKTTVAAQAANMATQKGMLFVASAGNEGGGAWNMVLTPGDADSALTIGSVDYTGTMAPNSGYGPNAAGRVKPDVCGMGQAAAVFIGLGYGGTSGTSFSTPQIAGWAACLWQSLPTARPHDIRDVIIKCADSYAAPGPQRGYGIPDVNCAHRRLLSITDTLQPFVPPMWVDVVANPTADILTVIIAADTEQNIDFSIYDLAGRKVLSSNGFFSRGYNSPFTIDVTKLATGAYVLKAVSPTKQQVVKVVKM